MDAHGETRPRNRRHSNRKNKEARNVEFQEAEVPRDKIIEEDDAGDDNWNNYHVEEESGASLTYKILFFVLLLLLGGLATLVLIDNNNSSGSVTQVNPSEGHIQSEVEESYIASSWLDWLTHEDADDHGLVEEHDEEAHEFIDDHDEDHEDQEEVHEDQEEVREDQEEDHEDQDEDDEDRDQETREEVEKPELPVEETQSRSEAMPNDRSENVDTESDAFDSRRMDEDGLEGGDAEDNEQLPPFTLSERIHWKEVEEERTLFTEGVTEEEGVDETNFAQHLDEDISRNPLEESSDADESKFSDTRDELDDTMDADFNEITEDVVQPDLPNQNEDEIIDDLEKEFM